MSGKGKPGKGQKKKRQYQVEREGISDFLCNAVGFNRGGGTPPMPPLGQPTVAVGNDVEVSLQPAHGNGGALVDISAKHNDAAVSSFPHNMSCPCPKLSEPQRATDYFLFLSLTPSLTPASLTPAKKGRGL